MRVVVQRVSSASVKVEHEIVGSIKKGLLLFVGLAEDDTKEDVNWLLNKIINQRIFHDSSGKMNLSILDVQGEILCISQFTLLADCKKGNRPSFIKAMRPELAIPLYDYFIEELNTNSLLIQTGVFGQHMEVSLVNDGPVTIIMDSKSKR